MTNYPLSWPSGWRRITTANRKDANFKRYSQRLSVADGVARVLEQLRLFGIWNRHVVISTNIEPRLDGMPRSNTKQALDPGVAVYWKVKASSTHRVMAIDLYDRVADNLAAVAATLEAMRAIERHGGAMILERVFTGFTALPSPNDWRHVLGFEHTPSFDEARKRFKELALKNHSDTGGSDVRMAELNGAWDAAQRELA